MSRGEGGFRDVQALSLNMVEGGLQTLAVVPHLRMKKRLVQGGKRRPGRESISFKLSQIMRRVEKKRLLRGGGVSNYLRNRDKPDNLRGALMGEGLLADLLGRGNHRESIEDWGLLH